MLEGIILKVTNLEKQDMLGLAGEKSGPNEACNVNLLSSHMYYSFALLHKVSTTKFLQ